MVAAGEQADEEVAVEALVILPSPKQILAAMTANVVSANVAVANVLFVTVHLQQNWTTNHLHLTTNLEVEEASLPLHLRV
jgi:hypothetical protein